MTGSQRTTTVTNGPPSALLSGQDQEGAAGRRDPPEISDTEEATRLARPPRALRAAACGGRARPGRAATPDWPAYPTAAAWRATGPPHHSRRPRQSRTSSGPV